MRPVIVWFRRDLRLADNPALHEAAKDGAPVVPVFIWTPEEDGAWAPGRASRSWLHHSLHRLGQSLSSLGSSGLVIRRGPALAALRDLLSETRADRVYWNRDYEPAAVQRDAAIKEVLRSQGTDVRSFKANLLVEPWELQNSIRKPFLVFTPFWKKLSASVDELIPLAKPRALSALRPALKSLDLNELKLLPRIGWDSEFYPYWEPGEAGAIKKLQRFVQEHAAGYDSGRNDLSSSGTSRLSPHLHFGEISAREVWAAVRINAAKRHASEGSEAFLRQLGWREFAYHLLFHFPRTPEEPLRRDFSHFPWRQSAEHLRAWQTGRTGYPIIDAGMRQLWQHGWMHNRVRMVAASFLVKDLLIPWQEGARWFWDTLVDADLANNTLGWQWTAGCGADAAPYFRVFNPVLQGERYDAEGSYVRRYLPELAKLRANWIHRPWEAPEEELNRAGVALGDTYPLPIVDHSEAKDAALDAYDEMKSKGKRRGTK